MPYSFKSAEAMLAQSGRSDNCEQQGNNQGECPGKHITGVAVLVLLQDADLLICQNP
jgi:hypothetical protein